MDPTPLRIVLLPERTDPAGRRIWTTPQLEVLDASSTGDDDDGNATDGTRYGPDDS